MLRVALGSKNPAKLRAVQSAFERMGIAVEVTGIDTPSKVSDQPFSDEETIQGALNRAKGACGSFDYGIGLEGGVAETPYGLFLCNWGAIVNQEGQAGIGGGVRVQLPEEIAEQVRSGQELGSVIDDWACGQDIKKKEGTIGILTQNHITRSKMFEDVVICAFSRFMGKGHA